MTESIHWFLVINVVVLVAIFITAKLSNVHMERIIKRSIHKLLLENKKHEERNFPDRPWQPFENLHGCYESRISSGESLDTISVRLLNIAKMQREHLEWSKRNFPDNQPWHPFVGMIEELCECAHAFLKTSQGIRTNEDHKEQLYDSLGDIFIYMMDFANHQGIDLGECFVVTWDKVKQRDWHKNKENGAGI